MLLLLLSQYYHIGDQFFIGVDN